MNVDIKIAELKDIDKIMEIQHVLFKRWDEIDPADKIYENWFQTEKHREFLKKAINDKNSIILIALNEKEIIGYIKAEVEEREPFLKKIGYIAEAYITPAFRRKNIGKKLFDEVVNWFREKKIEWLLVSTHVKDEVANNFWKKCGFEYFNSTYKIKID
jgi:ribosomal protein S18 acetylase RimI-like enzyme